MTFEQYPAKLPNLKKIQKKMNALINEFKAAPTAKDALRVVNKVIKYGEDFKSDIEILSVRYQIDTRDEFHQKAIDLIDEISPQITELFHEYDLALLNSPFRSELEAKLGKYYFDMLEVGIKTFSPAIIEDLQEENKLTTQHGKLLASAQIDFRGEKYTLAQLGKFMQDKDRETRRLSSEAYFNWFAENQTALETIYDNLVKVRDKMAKKLGFKNYVELGYLNLGRIDYDAEKVAVYRDQIYREVTPVWNKLYRRQAKRIGIKNMKSYDLSLGFLTGNPTPIGTTDEKVAKATQMYDAMSLETSEFFRFMVDNHLLDLDAKTGKSGGGFMTYFSKYKAPFIFANFNGTQGDVDVLTHEVGHAFQGYESRNIKIPAYRSPTLESCEIHSMSMEFFARPYMQSFFGPDEEKYLFSHLEGAIRFLPYGVTVDEFQHFVYENPTATPAERNAKWREIELKYRPLLNDKGVKFLEEGGRWMRQSHIFSVPFYYIDYTLAQVVAFQFAVEMEKDYAKAWKKYVKLCRLGGRYPFVTLLKNAKLRNPFEDGNVRKVIRPLAKMLDRYDDTKF